MPSQFESTRRLSGKSCASGFIPGSASLQSPEAGVKPSASASTPRGAGLVQAVNHGTVLRDALVTGTAPTYAAASKNAPSVGIGATGAVAIAVADRGLTSGAM